MWWLPICYDIDDVDVFQMLGKCKRQSGICVKLFPPGIQHAYTINPPTHTFIFIPLAPLRLPDHFVTCANSGSAFAGTMHRLIAVGLVVVLFFRKIFLFLSRFWIVSLSPSLIITWSLIRTFSALIASIKPVPCKLYLNKAMLRSSYCKSVRFKKSGESRQDISLPNGKK